MSAAGACLTGLDAGLVRGVLAAVDCQTRGFAQGGYLALTGPQSPLPTVATAALTIYVALIGWGLLFGRGGVSLSDAPRLALKIGMVLALIGSWSLFQTLVFDVADKAPLQLAQLAAAPLQQPGALTADPLDGLQVAYDELSASARAFGRIAGPTARAYTSGEAAAAEALSAAAAMLFMSTAGLLAICLMAVGVLTALGPVFVILFLFTQTRGLFVGWLRALLAAAIAPVGVWALSVMVLAVLEPWLVELARQRAEAALDPDTGLAASAVVFVFAAGQAALAAGAVFVAAAFRLRPPPVATASAAATARAVAPLPATSDLSRPQRLALAMERSIAHLPAAQPAMARSGARIDEHPRRQGPVSTAFDPTPRLGDAYRRPAVRNRAKA